MKKILFAAVALVAMASCATEDVVSRPDNKLAIEFDNAFVENSTRAADINKDNLANFGVYGSVINSQDQQGMVFANKKVTVSEGKYTYQDPQYWIEGASYDFLAFAPYADAKWAYAPTVNTAAENGTISFDNEGAQANQDFLFAYAAKTTESNLTSAPAPVAFTFNHMLSRVKFTITNGFTANSNIKLDITNLTITNAHSEGTLAIKEGVPQTWAVGTDVFARNFGSTTQLADNNTSWTTEHFYLIPTEATYNVTFDVTLWQAGVPVDTYSRTATVTLDMEMGKSYNVKASLNASNTAEDGKEIYPIEFTVEAVEAWENFEDVDATVPEHIVSNAAELAAAVAEGGVIALTSDINLDELPTTLANERYAGLTISKNTVIDGAGFTVSSSAIRAINVAGDANLDVTIKNLVVEAKGERAINVELCKSVTIDNVTASANHYALNLVGAADNVTVVADNCNFNGLTGVNVWGENAKVTLNDSVLNLVDDNASEGYGAIQINGDAVNSVVTVNGGKINITGSANDDSFGGVVIASGASIIFNGTEGTTTIEGQPFVINYDNGYTYSFSTFAEAVETAKDGDTIVMTQDLTTDKTLKVTNKKITLDLNGKSLNVTNPGVAYTDAITAATGAELTITGNGTVSADWGAIVAMKDAKVVVENGTFYGNESEVVFVQNTASVEILGGSYKQNEDPSITLNKLDKYRDTTSIVVKGGKYFQFNPANNAAEGEGTNFLAAGYTVEQEGDWYIVK